MPALSLTQRLDTKAREYADTDSPLVGLCEQASDYIETLENAVQRACDLIERADARNLANDGPAGGLPPQMSLDEWRELYTALNETRPSLEPDEADYPGRYHEEARRG